MWIHRKVAREARGGWPLRLFFRRSGGLGWFLALSMSAVAPASAQVDPEGTTGRAIVAAFDIHGAESVHERELRAALQTRASPRFPWRDYDSPFGPLRLDLGHQLTPIAGLRMEGEPRDRRWRVHVAFGHSF